VETAFVLGGGGVLGAHEVGMLRALSEAGIAPDVVVGTSVGAINGAFVAADPAGAAAWLAQAWQGEALQQAFSETILGQVARLARSGTHLHSIEPLRRMLEEALPGGTGSTRRWRRCPVTSGCTCCHPGPTSASRTFRSSATGTGPASGRGWTGRTRRPRGTSPN